MNSRIVFNSSRLAGRVRSMYTKPMSQPLGDGKVLPSARMLRLREKFQMENGVPLYVKGGVFDRLLFTLTATLSAIGVIMSVHTIYKLAFPKK